MIPTLRVLGSRTTYRGARGSGPGRSSKTDARSSPFSKPTALKAQLAGRTFKAAQRVLYHGAMRQSGNSIPHSRQKTARTWHPNVQRKNALWSEVLQRGISCRVTTRAMRIMKKNGGLDQYIQKTNDGRLGAFGRDLRAKMALAAIQKKEKEEAKEKLDKAMATLKRYRQGLGEAPTREERNIIRLSNLPKREQPVEIPPTPLQLAFAQQTAAAASPFQPVKPTSALASLSPTPQQHKARLARLRLVRKIARRPPTLAALAKMKEDEKRERKAIRKLAATAAAQAKAKAKIVVVEDASTEASVAATVA